MERNRTDWREKEEVLTQNSSGSSRTSPVSSPLSLLSLALSPPMHQVRPDNLRDWRERFFFLSRVSVHAQGPALFQAAPPRVHFSSSGQKTGTVSNDPLPKRQTTTLTQCADVSRIRFQPTLVLLSDSLWTHLNNEQNHIQRSNLYSTHYYRHLMEGKKYAILLDALIF